MLICQAVPFHLSDVRHRRARVKKGIELADDGIEEFAFDLNKFYKTNESGKFVHDADVDKFLDTLKRQEKFPFSTLPRNSVMN